MTLNKFSDFYIKFDKHISVVSVLFGFIFTALTLTSVDRFMENVIITLHLLIVAFGIIALTFHDNQAEKKGLPETDREKFNFYLTIVIQFAFGGLFSTFFIFYMRSSSLVESWLFLLLLVTLVVGNEIWKKHYTRLSFQISGLFLAIYLFAVFLLPVVFHRLGADLFLASGLLSLVIIILFLFLLSKLAGEKFKQSRKILTISLGTIFIVMNVLYFTNVIPPIPLSLKDSGVYHGIVKTGVGTYQASAEPKKWQNYFTLYPVFHAREGESIYAFSAVFSPAAFAEQIVHQWQYYDEVKKEWINSSRIVLPIVGGRDNGFRTYSVKQGATVGKWRVKVETLRGQVIGRINFKIEVVPSNSIILNNITL